MTLRALTRDDVTIEVTCSPEDMHPDDSFGLDDPEEQKAIVDQILADAEWNEWAWCCVRVRVSWKGFHADDYLGACSYKSKEDFIESNDYYADMVDNALEELNKELSDTYETLKALEHTNTAMYSDLKELSDG